MGRPATVAAETGLSAGGPAPAGATARSGRAVWVQWTLVLAASALFALSFGLRYGVHNQQTYLLHGMHRADPTLFARDWLVTRTTDYHPAFAAIVVWLARAGHLAWGMALANVLLLVLVGLLLFVLARQVAGSEVLPVYLLLLGWLVFTDNKDVIASVADSALFPNYLGPSSLGALGLLAGLALHLRGQWLASGIAVALGGLVHVNYLVLAFPLFFLAQVLESRPGLIGRLLRQLGPCALVLLPRLGELLGVAGDPLAAEARRIFLIVRSPHHYVPMSFLPDFAPFFTWQALGLVGLAFLERTAPGLHRRLAAVMVALFSLIVVATLLTTVVYLPVVAQLYVWRLAPFAVLLAQLAFFTAVCRAGSRLPARIPSRWLLAALGLVLFAWGGFRGMRGLADEAAYLSAPLGGEDRLFAWARTTPRDALFVVSPDMQEFRLCAERAVVVDWKSTPVLPAELHEWYRRLLVTTGLDRIDEPEQADLGYARMGPRRMERLARELGADFVVFHQPFPRTRVPEFAVAFADRRYIVFALGAPPAPPADEPRPGPISPASRAPSGMD